MPQDLMLINTLVAPDATASSQCSSLEMVVPSATSKQPDSVVMPAAEIESLMAIDRWDLRRIPSAYFQATRPIRWMRFDGFPEALRPLAKRYFLSLAMRYSAVYVYPSVHRLIGFFHFFSDRHPGADNLAELNREDIVAFLSDVRESVTRNGQHPRQGSVAFMLTRVRNILRYIEASDTEKQPVNNIKDLFIRGDAHKYASVTHHTSFIPSSVIDQINTKIATLSPTASFVGLLMCVTGWHCTTILTLNLDTCLHKMEGRWMLRGQAHGKPEALECPLPSEIGQYLAAHRDRVALQHGWDFNPSRLLFGSYNGCGHLLPHSQATINTLLRRFIRINNIKDGAGNSFPLTCSLLRKAPIVETFLRAVRSRQYNQENDSQIQINTDRITRPLRLAHEEEAHQPHDPHAFDVEAMLRRDIWDLRRLSFLRPQLSKSIYYIRFTDVPSILRPLVKRYMTTVITRLAGSTSHGHLRDLIAFLKWFHAIYPSETNFSSLTRKDIEVFLVYVRQTPSPHRAKPTDGIVWTYVKAARQLLLYVAQTGEDAPRQSVDQLFWPGDTPKRQWRDQPDSSVKHVPDFVVRQLDRKLDQLPGYIYPVILLIRETGWRLSDVLNLRIQSCLEQTASGWWLRGDIPKTNVKGLKIPIQDELAEVILVWKQKLQAETPSDDNPNDYLFPALDTRRMGLPAAGYPIQKALRDFSKKHDIRDEDGNLFTLTTRALRHTRATEYINNGMSLIHIQKLFGHMTPEMTSRYAKIHDDTLRREWEKALVDGAVRIGFAREPQVEDTAASGDEDQISWEYVRHNLDAVRLPNGYCFKPAKGNCPTQAIPCHTCDSFCTTPEFLPQFRQEKEGLLIQIELGRSAGQPHWAGRNQEHLDRLEPIIAVLEAGKVHHKGGKSVREYPQNKDAAKANGNT